jgi:polysaccharide export outer membrane protein
MRISAINVDRRFLRRRMPRLVKVCTLLVFTCSLWLTPRALFAQSQAAPTETARADVLRPGDLIRLKIWREPDLSGDFPVGTDGVVVFPKIGSYKVYGETPETLKEKVLTAFQKVLRNSSIEFTPLRRVTVFGAVRKAGLYPVDLTMTIADALALAGGTEPTAAGDKVELLRGGKKIEGFISQGVRIADSQIQSGDQLFVPEKSWFSRNTSFVSAILSGGIGVIIALLVRR